MEDVALMLRVRDGDLEAFEALVTRHQHSVVGTAAKMLGSGADAEDILKGAGGFRAQHAIEWVGESRHYSTPISSTSPRWPVR